MQTSEAQVSSYYWPNNKMVIFHIFLNCNVDGIFDRLFCNLYAPAAHAILRWTSAMCVRSNLWIWNDQTASSNRYVDGGKRIYNNKKMFLKMLMSFFSNFFFPVVRFAFSLRQYLCPCCTIAYDAVFPLFLYFSSRSFASIRYFYFFFA